MVDIAVLQANVIHPGTVPKTLPSATLRTDASGAQLWLASPSDVNVLQGTDLLDQDQTLQFSGGYCYVVPAASRTANRNTTLGVAAALAGVPCAYLIVIRDVSGQPKTFTNGGASGGVILAVTNVVPMAISFVFDGTDIVKGVAYGIL